MHTQNSTKHTFSGNKHRKTALYCKQSLRSTVHVYSITYIISAHQFATKLKENNSRVFHVALIVAIPLKLIDIADICLKKNYIFIFCTHDQFDSYWQGVNKRYLNILTFDSLNVFLYT